MDIDRDARVPSTARGHDLGGAIAPSTRADAMLAGPSNEPRNSRLVFRSPSRNEVSAEEPAPPERGDYPAELQNLVAATDTPARDRAWDAFLEKHSRLLLHVARRIMPASESAMDAYAHVLERLRRDDCRALAGYSPDGRCRFTTWLVVVVRRMCVDFYRQRYGRPRNEQPSAAAAMEREARRRLESFVGVDEADVQIMDLRSGPEGSMRSEQLRRALDQAVSALPPDDQLLLKLRFHDEMSAQQIASVLVLASPFHVYRKLKNVCAELRRALMAAGIEDSMP